MTPLALSEPASLDLPTTAFEFQLPRGLLDDAGQVHQQGRMRLATARDELAMQKDVRVRQEPAYGTLILLARTIAQLGSLTAVTAEDLENLFASDLAYLREFYNRINQQGHPYVPTQCPQCSHAFEVELTLSGES
ncbi:hypothetical protein [Synechococcus sp. PCC 7336]|uniref:hypothetical protein n=1 Tax=Synechococcus sp. PCC 7336 TaxID=195250 RepID=UPI0003477B41|nr:hypothetical protein [Synechococcus sp. PCC 7336]